MMMMKMPQFDWMMKYVDLDSSFYLSMFLDWSIFFDCHWISVSLYYFFDSLPFCIIYNSNTDSFAPILYFVISL